MIIIMNIYTYKVSIRCICMKEEFGVNVLVVGHRCYRCEHTWVPRKKDEVPETCPKCRSPYWKKPKTRFTENDKKLNKVKKNE